ncbi:MAG: hypothetical protein K2N74_04615, partial [Clostridiales bacterium]|nr:hypothetical protein [Clostridiales bacterium]
SAMLAGVTELAARALTAFVLVKKLEFTGICFSDPLAWIAADLFLIITYYVVMAKITKRNTQTAQAENGEIEQSHNVTL